jgi:conjugal transfer pilus assembly protein TraA
MKDQTAPIVGEFQSLQEQSTRRRQAAQALLLIGTLCAVQMAVAGTGGESFDTIWVTLTDWMQGTLGRVVAGAMVLVGLVGGIVRQSIMSFATGVGGGVGLYNTPTIIEAIMTATIHIPN